MIQSRADSKGQPAFLSFRAMDRIMQNVGSSSFSYDGFKQMYDATPGLQDLVKDFNEDGITISTDEGGDEVSQANQDGGEGNVSAAAKRAAKKGLGNDL